MKKIPRAKEKETLAAVAKDQDRKKRLATATVKVDLVKAFEMRFKNHLSYEAIGRYFNATGAAVKARLKPYEELMNVPKVEDKEMAEMFKAASLVHLTEAVRGSKVKALKADRNMLAAAMALDKSRLLSGQSTDNIGVMVRLVREACEAAPLPAPPVTEMVTEAVIVGTEPSDN